MKILLLTFYFEPDLSAGSFRNTALVKALHSRYGKECNVDVVTTMPNRYNSFKESAKPSEEKDGIKVKRIVLPEHKSGFLDQIWSFKTYYSGVWKFLKNVDQDAYDIVVASSSRLFTAYLGARIANKINKPLYLDIRDIFAETIDNVVDNKVIRYSLLPVIKLIERYTINSATHLNIVSGGFESYFRKYYDGPISEFTNGIDEVFLQNDFSKNRSNDTPVITYAGNIGASQGLENIIPESAKKLSGKYIFQIVGDGGTKSKLVKALEENKLDNVKIINPVSRNELLKFYQESDYLFLHLNDYEAFKKVLPSKIFEYAATTKPIIAGVGGYAADFIAKNVDNAILFTPCNIEEFVEKLNQFESNDSDRKHFMESFRRKNIMNQMVQSIISCI
jgi:glycosyltransferase involved in cell wall biosynthesis